MSQQIANVNLAGATIGTTGSVNWQKLLTPPTIHQQMRPGQTSAATLLIHNESGAQLLLTFPDTGRTVSYPAGKWSALLVRSNELSLTYKVTAIAPSPLFTSLLIDFYWPGEPIDPMGTLGNSPIGGPAVAVTQVIQDGQPNAQTLVEATPTGQAQNVLITTDGAAKFLGNVSGNAFLGSTTANLFVDTLQSGVTSLGIFLGTYDGVSSRQPLSIGQQIAGAGSWLGHDGHFGGVAGQTTAGSFGVPVIVAQALDVSVAVTGDQVILSYAPAATGFYRINGYFFLGNGSSAQVTFRVTWGDNHSGTPTGYFSTGPSAGTTVTIYNGAEAALGTSAGYTASPLTVYAKTGTNIIVHYNDPTGTPADFVSAMIERLA